MERRKPGLVLLVGTALTVLLLVTAGCAPITVTPETKSTSSPAAMPTTRATLTVTATRRSGTAAAEGPARLVGTVRHAGQPAPNARVELRGLGWATNRTPPVATARADSQGNFVFENPPVGDYSVIGYFPDGEMDAGGWPPVRITAGSQIQGFVVPIERRIVLLSPIAGAPAAAAPTLSWKASDEAVKYRVWVIDAGTTEMVMDQTTTEVTLQVPTELKPGAYQWVVNGLNAGGELVATAEETFDVGGSVDAGTPMPGAQGETAGLPPACQPARGGETAVYSDREHGFCFTYPANFEKNTFDPGQIDVVGVVAGPKLDAAPDPLRATLLIEVTLAGDRDLKAAVEMITKEFAGQAGISIRQSPFVLGGTPAVLLEGVPGRGGSRDVVALQNGFRYRLMFMPDPQQGFPQVATNLQALFDVVTTSFTFLPPAVTESQGPRPRTGGMPRLPDEERAFNGAREALANKLGIDPLSIHRVDQQPQEWNDACLGLTGADEVCAQVITPGWLIQLAAAGRQYEAHTDQEGMRVRFVGLK